MQEAISPRDVWAHHFRVGVADNPGGSLDIDRDMDAMLSSKYAMTVIFRSQDDAERAGPVLLDIPGVVNVRFGGKTLDSDPA